MDDFRPPFFIAVKSPSTESQTTLTPPYINAIIQCISSAEALITTFLNMNLHETLQCPTFVFVRVVYASVILIKVSISASMPSSELGKVVPPESIKIEVCLEQLLVHLRTSATYEKGSKHVVCWKFLGILTKLKLWYQRQKQQSSTGFSSPSEFEQEGSNNHLFAAHSDIPHNSHGGPATNLNPWSGPSPPQQNHIYPPYQLPLTHKPAFYTDFAESHPVPAVDQGAPPTLESANTWPATFHAPARFSDPATLSFNYAMGSDPNLFNHLVNTELDQNSHETWLPDLESFNPLDFTSLSNLPDFNWGNWQQQQQ